MALSTSTRQNTRAAVAAAGTSVAPGAVIPDNCHTIIFLNRSAAQIILIGQGAPGGPHTFSGPAGGVTGFGTSTGALALPLNKKIDGLNIPVNSGTIIAFEAALIGEDPGDATISVGVQYEA